MRRIHSGFLLGLLLGILFGGTGLGPLLAQPISSTQPLREVLHLEPAPLPPGELVPYRAGKLLAYADTSGRVILPPFARWPEVDGTSFFKNGFVVVHPLLNRVLPLPGDAARRGEPVRLALLNARGEVLLVRRAEAAVLQPDGSVRVVPHWQAHGQPEVWETMAYGEPQYHFDNWLAAPAEPFYDQAPARAAGLSLPDTLNWEDFPTAQNNGWRLPHYPWLASGRVARRQENVAPRGNGDSGRRWALGDARGRVLTPYKYAGIERFYDGLAVAELPGPMPPHPPLHAGQKDDDAPAHRSRYTYLDTTGREVAGNFDAAGSFRHGRAVVGKGDRWGVIDAQGRFVVPLGKQEAYGPDEDGYIRLVQRGGNAHDDAVRILAPPGKPPIANTFGDCNGFRQGRAEASAGQRAGLIDETWGWVTPLAYERLRTPGNLHSEATDDDEYTTPVGDRPPPRLDRYRTFVFPDSTLLVGVRNGKIGLVARATGQEVVAARYDSVVLNPCHGMACLRRGAVDYLVSGFNGQEVAVTYRGVDFMTAQGRRLLVTRARPASWALADTLAQLRTPWLPAFGYPTAPGHLVSKFGFLVDSSALYSREGKLLLQAKSLAQPQWDAMWRESGADESYRQNFYGEATNVHLQLPVATAYPYAQGVYFAAGSTDHFRRVYDARLRPLGALPNPPRGGKQRLTILESGWSILTETIGEGAKAERVVRQWFTDTGQPLPPAPPGTRWVLNDLDDHPRMWRKFGVLPSTLGYVTRGRRQLWRD